jgi:putative ABC transport system permease protein
MESKTLPLLKNRLKGHLPKVGEIVIPELIAKGMKLKIGDRVVLVVTNRSGSMNAKTLKISGIVGILTGPGGRDGYINIKDARFLLRIKKPEINEIVIKLKNPQKTLEVTKELKKELKGLKPLLEVHPWQKLTPFTNIANMIDVMTISVEIVLISIVLISILNIMIMSVYERIKLIGTLKAIGTKKSFILSMFVSEGVLLGIFGLVLGIVGSLVFIFAVGDIHYSFGRIKDLILHPELDIKIVIMVSVLVLVVSIFASLYPASKAANLRVVEALRS